MSIVLPEALRIGLMAGGLLLVIPGLATVLHRYRKRHGVFFRPDRDESDRPTAIRGARHREVRARDVDVFETREPERERLPRR